MLSPIELERALQALIDNSDPDDFDTIVQKLFYDDEFDFKSAIKQLDELITDILEVLQSSDYKNNPTLLRQHKSLLANCIKSNFDFTVDYKVEVDI
jgi:hypothetical protein